MDGLLDTLLDTHNKIPVEMSRSFKNPPGARYSTGRDLGHIPSNLSLRSCLKNVDNILKNKL
jgi:hypothetical protein